tara:strand:- start:57 stop:167 length:111 start_codon:yes stop_codon:yes gene_type:complete
MSLITAILYLILKVVLLLFLDELADTKPSKGSENRC